MPLSAPRNTRSRDGGTIVLKGAAAKKYWPGALVARDANGRATPGAASTTILGVGRCTKLVDNSAGADDAVDVTIDKGIFLFKNSSAGDLIADADIGNNCFIVDDETVAKTNGTNTRSVAGKVFDVDAEGVWVDLR